MAGTQTLERTAARSATRARGRLAEDLERLMADAGISVTALARAAGVPHGHVSRILAGKTDATIETYAKLAVPLGADLSARLYPNTGPLIRDRHQGRIAEALLGEAHPRWNRFTEVGVRQPARGWIDIVLHDSRASQIVAVEVESDIRTIEQKVRWARMKADSLPSWEGWPSGGDSTISQVLIVRRTRATRATAVEFARQLAVAYPAHPEDALASIRGSAPWPGAVLIWAHIGPRAVRFLSGRSPWTEPDAGH